MQFAAKYPISNKPGVRQRDDSFTKCLPKRYAKPRWRRAHEPQNNKVLVAVAISDTISPHDNGIDGFFLP